MSESTEPLRNAIEALLAEFAYLLDHGQADQAVPLFTEDAAFVSPLATLRGRAPRPFLVADCLDAYERGADGRWCFAERTAVPVFVARAEAPAPASSGASG